MRPHLIARAATRVLAGAALAATAAAQAAPAIPAYPQTPRHEVTDTYHGTEVADPYRWLEDTDSSETAAWVKAQNKLSLPFLAALPTRAEYHKRLTELWNFERYGVPTRKAGKLFYTRNDGLQNQSVLYVKDTDDAAPRVLIDPNKWSSDGTTALVQWEVPEDGKHLAYAVAQAGSDWNEFKVLDVATGKDTGDHLKRIKFSTIEWTRDGRGFFYSRYPDRPKDAKPGAKETVFDEIANQKLYYHRLGTAQADDPLVHERPDQPKWSFEAVVSDDGRFLFILARAGTDDRNALYYKYLGDPAESPKLDAKTVALVERMDSQYRPIGNEGSVVYLLTTSKAPKKRIIAADLRSPDSKHWVSIVPEGEDAIETARVAGRQFIVLSMHDAHHRLQRYTMGGNPLPELKLPGLGSVTSTPVDGLYLSTEESSTELFYSYTDYSHPPQNQRCDLARGKCEPFQPVKLAFNPDDYATEQVFFRSSDGTRVPMFVSYKKGWNRRKDGTRPTILYGYGGFDYAQLPSFARNELAMPALAWMERGGLYAVANLRGGGEYGRAWHEAGKKQRKQNTFDDFINAAHYLIKQGYTTTPQLAIHGRSNGGLLVGAVVNQKPELFGAAVADVGVMDMLRFHKFTIGWAWVDDYGSSDDPKMFKTLYAYSPYHNIKPGTKYPAVLATTADHDDRVVPGHSFKYMAALQAAQAGDRPVLIRIDVKSGHGGGKPTAKLIDEVADRLAFITEYTQKPAAQQ
jgi:prolyl oligopeptidase